MAAISTAFPPAECDLLPFQRNREKVPLVRANVYFFKARPRNLSFHPFYASTSIKSSASMVERKCGTKSNYNAEICRLCEMGNLTSAVDLLCNVDVRNSHIESKTFCSVLQLCADLKSLSDGVKVQAVISSLCVEVDALLGLKLVFFYIKCGDLASGRRVFDSIPKENIFLWNLVMNEYMKIGERKESISLFRQMQESGVEPNSHTFTCILKSLASLGSVKVGKELHGHIMKFGFDRFNAVENALISFYSKSENIGIARAIFDEMSERDIISWNTMISGYVSNGLPEEGIHILQDMWFVGFNLDLATLVSVLPACAQTGFLSQGRTLHGYAIKNGHGEQLTLNNSLLNMYTSCGDLDSGVQVFSTMNKRTVVSWTSMMSGYVQDGQFDKAISLFKTMKGEGVEPDVFAVTTVLRACTCNGSLEHAKDIHEFVVNNGFKSHLFVGNALMDMYAKCGRMNEAKSVFESVVVKDVVSWNTIIGGYSKNCCPNEALVLFNQMLLEDLKPNSVTMACLLPACASLSTLERGREIHGYSLRNGFMSDRFVANALVDMYAKCGAIAQARLLFDRIQAKDLVSWTVMIAGYGMHGCGKDAISSFNEMLESGIEPNEVCLNAILYACSHSGLVDEGRRFFHIMRYDCKMEPKLEHYVCMVDLLARAGRLTKAYQFIQSMPIEPDSTVWGALLYGCRIHRDVKLAENVAEHVFELEPENTVYYILLANIYAEAEEWDAVKKLRERIGRQRLKKQPGSGCSWIEIKSKLHVFVSGDKSHPQAKKIWTLLESMDAKMKEEGHILSKRYAAINDEAKEEVLCGHSERLAMAFGILNCPPKKPIRVSKNLRVCGDCHEVAKFLSKMAEREIILRDSNRFHHFVDGRCSCRGYW